jgi:glycosyltransferase involved in cell wall biosynthesis
MNTKGLKVVHIIPSLAKGGAERLVVTICKELTQRNNVECVLVNFHEVNDYLFDTNEINRKVIKASVVPSIKGGNRVEVKALQEFIDSYEPTIVHLHLFEAVIVTSQLKNLKAKIFIHFHDNMKQFKKFSFSKRFSKEILTNLYEKKLIEKSFSRGQVRYIGISKDVVSFIRENCPKQLNVELLPNAIEYTRFYNKVIYTQSVVIIGSLLPNKDHQLAIDVIHILSKRNVNVKLDVVGDGIEMGKLKDYVSSLNLVDSIQFHGKVDFPEKIIHQNSICLHTAKKEAFGLVLIEAMAAGLPVVCTDAGGNRDIMEDGKNGFIIENRSASELADKIQFLLENENSWKQMSSYAQEYAKNYDIKEYVDKLLVLYNS